MTLTERTALMELMSAENRIITAQSILAAQGDDYQERLTRSIIQGNQHLQKALEILGREERAGNQVSR